MEVLEELAVEGPKRAEVVFAEELQEEERVRFGRFGFAGRVRS